MTDFVGTHQFLKIALSVAMETMHLSHCPHKLFLRTMFSHLGSPIEQFGTMNNLAPIRNCPG